jgi:release factor glutamine methyltransferase
MPISQVMPTLQQCTLQLCQQLGSISDNPAHEARLLLCYLLSCQPGYLYTYPERVLTQSELQQLQSLLQRRLAGEPLAYIFGRWPFYGLELAVAPCTLIPRSDTEILVEQALALTLPAQARVLDLGTGTGAIALALAHNRPQWQLTGVDLQSEAVALAQRNAQALKLSNVDFTVSSWFSALSDQQYDLIVSNPPYIEAADPHLTALRFEPLSALVAEQQGLADLASIIVSAPAYLVSGGWLWLEHGYNQAQQVRQLLTVAGFQQVYSVRDYGGNWRISGGQRPLR